MLQSKKLNRFLIFGFLFAGIFLFIQVQAESVGTSVTVSNTAPAYDVAPAENPASVGTAPTNAGDDVTIEATATDPSGEDYYLIVCATDSASATNGGAPTCGGTQYCVSGATTSGSSTSCDITTNDAMPESNDWYAFVCDGNSSNAQCSNSSQGSGDAGSPFKVNHAPTFDTLSNNGPVDPGANVIFSSTASTTDGDTDTTTDTVYMVACKTAGVTNGTCDGGAPDTWCSGVSVPNGPSCVASIDSVAPSGTQDAYVYVFDSHLFGATGLQGSNSQFDINNVAPVVSSVTLNGGSDISLTEGTTTDVAVTATVTDNNSCQDLSSVTTSVYRSSVAYSGCDTAGEADNNECYPVVSCSVALAGNTCDSSTDSSAAYNCTVSMQYHADPTDASTVYVSDNWLSTVYAEDAGALSDNAEVSSGVEMLSLLGLNVTSAINYGTLNVGESNDPLDQQITITSTGNVGLDAELRGTDMTDGGSGVIDVSYQHYSYPTGSAYAAGTALTVSDVEEELNIAKTTVTGNPASGNILWGLLIPSGTTAGTYTGTNTVTGVVGETGDW